MALTFIQAYLEAFHKHYPAKDVRVKHKRHNGEWRYAVIIDGDKGDMLLSETDLREATRAFNK